MSSTYNQQLGVALGIAEIDRVVCSPGDRLSEGMPVNSSPSAKSPEIAANKNADPAGKPFIVLHEHQAADIS